jgi:hypothetical protein
VRTGKSSCVIADNPNVLLDHEIYKEARGMNAKQRLALAEKFTNWAEQLAASAFQMDPTVAKDVPEPAQIPRGYIMINIPQDDKKQLMKNARECGLDLRSVMTFVLRETVRRLQKEVMLTRLTGQKKQGRVELGDALLQKN